MAPLLEKTLIQGGFWWLSLLKDSNIERAIFEPIYIRSGFNDKRCLWRFCGTCEGQFCSAKCSSWAENFRIIFIYWL